MAQIDPVKIQIGVTEEIERGLKAIEEKLSEERIRAIVREELAEWEKRMQSQIRHHTGLPAHVETK